MFKAELVKSDLTNLELSVIVAWLSCLSWGSGMCLCYSWWFSSSPSFLFWVGRQGQLLAVFRLIWTAGLNWSSQGLIVSSCNYWCGYYTQLCGLIVCMCVGMCRYVYIPENSIKCFPFVFPTSQFYLLLCVSMHVYVWVCALMQVSVEARRGCWISWRWRSYELSDVGAWEENSGLPQEQCVLLTTALSSPSPYFWHWTCS